MNILFVISDLNIESGGVTTAACGLAEVLAARGHSVTIAANRKPGTPATPGRVTVKLFEPDKLSKLMPSKQLNAWLREHIHAFDVVHIHGIWQRHGHYAARAARKAAVPFLVAPHGMLDEACLRMGSPLIKRLAWTLWDGPMARHAWAVHCLNEAEYRVAPWVRGKLPVVIFGNGIAAETLAGIPPRGSFRAGRPDLFAQQPDRPIALFLSRIHPKKGLDRLLPHWRQVVDAHPTALLVIAGTGDAAYTESLQALCKSLNIDKSVAWVGQLVGPQKWAALADADVFVLPSHQEGFSLAITEALAAGCPAVITDECHFDEVRAHNAGIVIDAGDMTAFAAAINRLLADAATRQRMSASARQLVADNFTWDRIAATAERAYTAMKAGQSVPRDLRAKRGLGFTNRVL